MNYAPDPKLKVSSIQSKKITLRINLDKLLYIYAPIIYYHNFSR